jgi:succinate dehydrogenase/fumarate reductase cytochrome b subunit
MKKSEFFLKVFLAAFIFALLFFGVRVFAGDHGHTILSKLVTPSSLLAVVICALSLFAALIAAIWES